MLLLGNGGLRLDDFVGRSRHLPEPREFLVHVLQSRLHLRHRPGRLALELVDLCVEALLGLGHGVRGVFLCSLGLATGRFNSGGTRVLKRIKRLRRLLELFNSLLGCRELNEHLPYDLRVLVLEGVLRCSNELLVQLIQARLQLNDFLCGAGSEAPRKPSRVNQFLFQPAPGVRDDFLRFTHAVLRSLQRLRKDLLVQLIGTPLERGFGLVA
mmetsp:Transcript_109988/g.310198  ORF Transcript_109988/g.310198 Transcript_109988/m.310198 type:complete len:212 (+) Transcript_109988:939-1574(+)